jgi:hypothetical protein
VIPITNPSTAALRKFTAMTAVPKVMWVVCAAAQPKSSIESSIGIGCKMRSSVHIVSKFIASLWRENSIYAAGEGNSSAEKEGA